MSKDRNRNGATAVENRPETSAPVVEQAQPVAEVTAPVTAQPEAQAEPNHVIVYRRDHPGGGALGRCSYGIPGNPGIVVFDKSLFPDGNPPASITLDCVMVSPRTKVVTAKAQDAAIKAAERAAKAQAKIEAAAAKARERQEKADKALAEAKARVEAARASQTPATQSAS